MDDLVQQVVRELSFEGDLGKLFVLHLIKGHRPLPGDFPPSSARCRGFDSRCRLFIF